MRHGVCGTTLASEAPRSPSLQPRFWRPIRMTRSRGMPTIDLPADELAAVTAAIRAVIDGDRYPHAPRLDPLRAALGKFEAAAGANPKHVTPA
jgi:hypothetical protein